jgi:hypothetical protein
MDAPDRQSGAVLPKAVSGRHATKGLGTGRNLTVGSGGRQGRIASLCFPRSIRKKNDLYSGTNVEFLKYYSPADLKNHGSSSINSILYAEPERMAGHGRCPNHHENVVISY